jgi:hypothetical protein
MVFPRVNYLVRGCRTNLDSCIFMRQSIEAAYLTRAFVTRTHEYAFRKDSCDSLVRSLSANPRGLLDLERLTLESNAWQEYRCLGSSDTWIAA